MNQNTNLIILILLTCIIIYFIIEKCRFDKLNKAKKELFTVQNENKNLEKEYSKIYQKVNDKKFESVTLDKIKIPVKDDRFKTNGVLDKYEEKLIEERQKSRQLTTQYANQFCQNMINNQKHNKPTEKPSKLSEEELQEIEKRIFSRNIDELHHKLHHQKHIPHSHANDKPTTLPTQNSDLEKKRFNDLLKKYNKLKRGQNKMF